MPIILENQEAKAGVRISGGDLHINFTDDPSYIRSESILIDLMQRSIGIIFEGAYHHIGPLPICLAGADIAAMSRVRLTGQGEGGREIELHAPLRIAQ